MGYLYEEIQKETQDIFIMLLLFIISIISFFLFKILKDKVINSFETEQTLIEFTKTLLEKNELYDVQIEISDKTNHLFFNSLSKQLVIPASIIHKQNVFYQYWVTVQTYHIKPKIKNKIRNGFVVFLSRHIRNLKKFFFALSVFTFLNLDWGWVNYSYLFIYIIPSLIFVLILFIHQFFSKMKIISLYHQISNRQIDQLSFFIALHYYILSFLISPGGIIWYWKHLFFDNHENQQLT